MRYSPKTRGFDPPSTPRRRGGKAAKRGLSDEQVPTLVLRDRFGQTADYVLARDDARHIAHALASMRGRGCDPVYRCQPRIGGGCQD